MTREEFEVWGYPTTTWQDDELYPGTVVRSSRPEGGAKLDVNLACEAGQWVSPMVKDNCGTPLARLFDWHCTLPHNHEGPCRSFNRYVVMARWKSGLSRLTCQPYREEEK